MNNSLNIRQQLLNTIEEAINLLTLPDADPHFVVHEVRKNLKKVRAYLRLISDKIDFKKENRDFRDLAFLISDIRDLTSSLEALNLLREESRQLNPGIYQPVHSFLENKREYESRLLFEERAIFQQLADALTVKREEISNWELEIDSQEIQQNFHETMLQVKISGQKAITEDSTEGYHEWRKKIKHMRYQLEYLAGKLLPGNEEIWISLNRLSDYIGWDHDLAVLESFIREGEPIENNKKDKFFSVLNRRRSHLKELAKEMKENELPNLLEALQ